MMIKNSLLLLISFALVSCGGGGGGGGSSALLGGGVVTPPAPTYTYKKISETAQSGGTFDSKAITHSYRRYPETGLTWRSTGAVNFATNIDGAGNVSVSLKRNYSFTPTGGSSPLDASIDVSLDFPADYSNYYGIGNILDDYMFWLREPGETNDLANLTSQEWTFTFFDFYADTGPTWLGTEYVTPFLAFINYGKNCLFCDDTNPNEDVIAGVYGDFTEVGDMPNSGSVSYDVKALARWQSGTRQSDGSYENLPALEGNGSFTANFGTMKVEGSILLDYVFAKQSYSLSWPRLAGLSAGSIGFQGDISGNAFSGTTSWGSEDYGSGIFEGNFFGPDGDEIGGYFDAKETEGFDAIVGSFVGCKSVC